MTFYKALTGWLTVLRNDSGIGSTVMAYTCPANRNAIAYLSITAMAGGGTATIYNSNNTATKINGVIGNLGAMVPGAIFLQPGDNLMAQYAAGGSFSVTMTIQIFEFAIGIEV